MRLEVVALSVCCQLVLGSAGHSTEYIRSAIEYVDEQNRVVGAQAARDFPESIRADRIYEGSIQYRIADRNSHLNDLLRLRERAQSVLRSVNGSVDTSLLGFGWLPRFGEQRLAYFRKREGLVRKLRGGTNMTDQQVRDALENGQDRRPNCEQWKDVAQVFAQALIWDRAAGLVQSKGCIGGDLGDQYTLKFLQASKNPKAEALAQVAYKASLIGYFSMGVKSEFSPQDRHKVQPVIDFATSLLSYQRESVELQAAIVSLIEKVTEKFSKTEPTTAAIVSSEVRQSFERLIPALNQVDSLKVDFKPVIEQAFEEWKTVHAQSRISANGGKTPYYMYAQALHQYYKKYEDPWQSWLWLQEAYASRPSSGHNANWTRDSYSLIHRRAAAVAYHLLGKNHDGKDALQVMSEKLAVWDGKAMPRPSYQTYFEHISQPEYLKWLDQPFPKKAARRVHNLEEGKLNVWKAHEKQGLKDRYMPDNTNPLKPKEEAPRQKLDSSRLNVWNNRNRKP